MDPQTKSQQTITIPEDCMLTVSSLLSQIRAIAVCSYQYADTMQIPNEFRHILTSLFLVIETLAKNADNILIFGFPPECGKDQ